MVIRLASPRPTRLPLTIGKFQNRSMHSCLCPRCAAVVETNLVEATQGGARIFQYHHAVALDRRLERAVMALDCSTVLRPRTLHNYVCNNISWAPRGVAQGRRIAVSIEVPTPWRKT